MYGDDKFTVMTDDDNDNSDPYDDADTTVPEVTDAPTVAPRPTAAGQEAVETEPPTAAAVPSTPGPDDSAPANAAGGDGGNEEETPPPDGGDGGNRRSQRLLAPFQNSRALEDGAAKQIMDVVLFMVPEDCKKDSWGTCDWAKLGVGVYDDMMEGGISYCCSADTAGRGKCDQDDIGTLIVDPSVFQGDHRRIVVPQSTNQEFTMEDPRFDIDESGDYVWVISNCNDFGLEVLALGNMEWKSARGYLPGDMFELMLFYGALTGFYLVLAVWYYCGMRMYQDAAIPIQKYILATIVIGFLEVMFRTADFAIWNNEGLRSSGIMYTGQSCSCVWMVTFPHSFFQRFSNHLFFL